MLPVPAHHVLIVESDSAFRDELRRTVAVYADVEAVGDFPTAYAHVLSGAFDLLVTNLRLESTLEGLQLAFLAASGGHRTRAVVYGATPEPWIVHEIQRAGAFYEARARLVLALPAYAQADLPVLDRRDPVLPDRRARYRGGRRAADITPLMASR